MTEPSEALTARLTRGLVITLIAGVATFGTAAGVRAWLVQDGVEADRLAEVLRLRPGAAAADVGAGEGAYTKILSARVGPEGRVFATEVNQKLIRRLESLAASLGNVTVVSGTQSENGLPTDCCDAILLRLVYHHFTDPKAMQAELARALRTEGLLAIVDMRPGRTGTPAGVPKDRGGHGITPELLIKEMTDAGFEVVERIDDWPGGRGTFCVVFKETPKAERFLAAHRARNMPGRGVRPAGR